MLQRDNTTEPHHATQEPIIVSITAQMNGGASAAFHGARNIPEFEPDREAAALDIADPLAREALRNGLDALRHADGEFAKLLAVKNAAEALEPFNEEEATDQLSNTAIKVYGLDPDLVTLAMGHGFEAAVERRDREARKPNGKAKGEQSRFNLIPFHEITLQTAAAYLVAGLIPRVGLTLVWGPKKCGKSFWVFDLVMHIALGWLYRGRKVRQGDVVYLSLEGNIAFNRRVEAFRRRNKGVTRAHFHLITTRISLVKDHPALIADIKAQSANAAVIVIDTLNRSIDGSESKDEDMSAYVKAADAVCEAFGCAVIIIHHCGVDETRPRGHTALGGAIEAQLAVHRNAAKDIITEIEWMKDGSTEGEVIVSRLESVPLGQDDDGNELSSCVVVPADGTIPAKRKLSPTALAGLRALHECLAEMGKKAPILHAPVGVTSVTLTEWREYLFKTQLIDREGSYREEFKRIHVTLKNAGAIGIWDENVWAVT